MSVHTQKLFDMRLEHEIAKRGSESTELSHEILNADRSKVNTILYHSIEMESVCM